MDEPKTFWQFMFHLHQNHREEFSFILIGGAVVLAAMAVALLPILLTHFVK